MKRRLFPKLPVFVFRLNFVLLERVRLRYILNAVQFIFWSLEKLIKNPTFMYIKHIILKEKHGNCE